MRHHYRPEHRRQVGTMPLCFILTSNAPTPTTPQVLWAPMGGGDFLPSGEPLSYPIKKGYMNFTLNYCLQVIVMLGAAAHICGHFIYAHATISNLMYVGGTAAALGPCVAPLIRSMTSKLLPASERGRPLRCVCEHYVVNKFILWDLLILIYSFIWYVIYLSTLIQ